MLKIPLYLCELPSPGKERDQLVCMEVGDYWGDYWGTIEGTMLLLCSVCIIPGWSRLLILAVTGISASESKCITGEWATTNSLESAPAVPSSPPWMTASSAWECGHADSSSGLIAVEAWLLVQRTNHSTDSTLRESSLEEPEAKVLDVAKSRGKITIAVLCRTN